MRFLSLPSKLSQNPFNDQNLKRLGKRDKNGVSTLLVLSMRPHAHISLNHVKREYSLSQKHMHHKTNNTKSSQVNMHFT